MQVWKELQSATRKALHEFMLLEGVEHVGVALSGGKDSLTLLMLLHAISGRGFQPFKLHAFHVQGPVSCGAALSEGMLSKITSELNVPLHVLRDEQQEPPKDCYMCSRRRRSLIFNAAKQEGCTTIAFGHHQDDAAETVLLNLFQKGEFTPLLPKIHMVHYGVTIIRPLILIREERIRAFAQEKGFMRFTCSCPLGATSMRRQVKELLQQASRKFPHVVSNVASGGLTYGSRKAEISS